MRIALFAWESFDSGFRGVKAEVVWLYNAPTDKCRVIYNGVWPKNSTSHAFPAWSRLRSASTLWRP